MSKPPDTPERCGGSGRLRVLHAQGFSFDDCPGCPDCQPKRCPTCGSDEPAKRNLIDPDDYTCDGNCPDTFHGVTNAA